MIMLLNFLIWFINRQIKNPTIGLPERIFEFISSNTPLVNVDLLIKNPKNPKEILLTWREDQFYKGWHIPGGIIRFKETAEFRVRKVAEIELRTTLKTISGPIYISEKINTARCIRGHFVSLLYKCSIDGKLNPKLEYTKEKTPKPGEWKWFSEVPNDFLVQQSQYKKYFQI